MNFDSPTTLAKPQSKHPRVHFYFASVVPALALLFYTAGFIAIAQRGHDASTPPKSITLQPN